MKLLIALAALSCVAPVSAADVFGPFRVDPAHPEVMAMVGAIDPNAPIQFRRALEAYPSVQTIGLDSPGGDVTAGLLLALEVHDRAIDTVITSGAACYSACAYVFLAGASRRVSGDLGVHMPMPAQEYENWRVTVELDIRFVLVKLDVPLVVFDGIVNTPHDQLRVFSAAEAVEVGLNR